MADSIHLTVVTADGSSREQMVSYVNIPTSFGSVGVLAGHATMYVSVVPGILKFRNENGTFRLQVDDGVASVENNEVSVLVKRMKPVEGTIEEN